jgi:hypothetical protein
MRSAKVRSRTEFAADRPYIVLRRHYEGILMEVKTRAIRRGNLQDVIGAWALRADARVCAAINAQYATIGDKVRGSCPIPRFLRTRIPLDGQLVP